MKKNIITINKKNYPVNFGFYSIAEIQEAAGGVSDIDEFLATDSGEVSLLRLAQCLTIVINAGYEENGEGKTVTEKEIGEQMLKNMHWDKLYNEFLVKFSSAIAPDVELDQEEKTDSELDQEEETDGEEKN